MASQGTPLPLAFGALGVATLFVVSGMKGVTIGDVLSGKANNPLDPTGGKAATPIDFGAHKPVVVDGQHMTDSVNTGDTLTTKPGGVLSALKAEMDRMDRLHSYYVFGGSHINYNKNGPWDCSSAVSQALHAVGLLSGPPRTSGLLMAYGKSGHGAHVTIYTNPTHCYMVVDGRAWAWRHKGTMGGWMDSVPNPSGFTVRHPDGL